MSFSIPNTTILIIDPICSHCLNTKWKNGTETWVNIFSLTLPWFNNLDFKNIVITKQNELRLTFTLFPRRLLSSLCCFFFCYSRLIDLFCLVQQLHQIRHTLCASVSMWATGMFCNLNVWNVAREFQSLWSLIFLTELSSSSCACLTLSQLSWIFHAFFYSPLFNPLSLFSHQNILKLKTHVLV